MTDETNRGDHAAQRGTPAGPAQVNEAERWIAEQIGRLSKSELLMLKDVLDNIAAGRPVEKTKAAAAAMPIRPDIVTRMNQGEWWRQKSGEWIRIADMASSHRRNTAAMLLRNAAAYELRYGLVELGIDTLHEAPDSVISEIERKQEIRMRDPEKWMRSTPLYRALVNGLDKEMTRR